MDGKNTEELLLQRVIDCSIKGNEKSILNSKDYHRLKKLERILPQTIVKIYFHCEDFEYVQQAKWWRTYILKIQNPPWLAIKLLTLIMVESQWREDPDKSIDFGIELFKKDLKHFYRQDADCGSFNQLSFLLLKTNDLQESLDVSRTLTLMMLKFQCYVCPIMAVYHLVLSHMKKRRYFNVIKTCQQFKINIARYSNKPLVEMDFDGLFEVLMVREKDEFNRNFNCEIVQHCGSMGIILGAAYWATHENELAIQWIKEGRKLLARSEFEYKEDCSMEENLLFYADIVLAFAKPGFWPKKGFPDPENLVEMFSRVFTFLPLDKTVFFRNFDYLLKSKVVAFKKKPWKLLVIRNSLCVNNHFFESLDKFQKKSG